MFHNFYNNFPTTCKLAMGQMATVKDFYLLLESYFGARPKFLSYLFVGLGTHLGLFFEFFWAHAHMLGKGPVKGCLGIESHLIEDL